MHPALQLNDIIYVIFRHLVNGSSLSYYESGGNLGQMTLAALARTCRVFHEPALDVLWGDLHFPPCLIHCLSDSGTGAIHYLNNTVRALTARDWEVLQKYVPRVMSVTFDPELTYCRNLLKALRQPPVAQPPLPNLQRLQCYSHWAAEDYPFLDVFFVPSLTDLAIEVSSFCIPDFSFISPLPILCPHLTSFRLFGYGSHESIKAIVSNVVMSLPHLQTLHCDQLSQAAITFVAWHPSLTKLDIRIPNGHPYDFSDFPHPTLPRIPPFSRIKSFGIDSLRLSVITAFIQVVQPSPFHLRITMNQGSSPEGLLELFSTLSNQQRQESIQSLRVQSYKSHEPRTAPIDIDTIRPLLYFSKLRELHLLMINSFHLSDKELTAMGASWPCLEVINLNNSRAQTAPSNITLYGLILLVNKCPLLRSAHLAINANVLKGIDEYPASMVGENDLFNLVLADTTVQNPRAFALIVSLAFPKVKEIAVGMRRPFHYGCHWDKVNEHLKAFRLCPEVIVDM
ncbi:hypothetical protein BDR03DRAFT_996768 [Suillus americanus]|nr:hypothetical protein BDR03DRAFT_996768 [Suillus americanus]